jgi:glutamate formiminotransferase/formiminotetrahydrofolate cyclodeaminase
MSSAWIECIPNFSEGRRLDVIEAIESAIRSAPGVWILDRHQDADHNRSVITFVAPPESVGQAAYQGIARAAELIDLNRHQGEHPRLGAADVVPFVPLEGTTMEECIDLARKLGQRVGEELHIPVYLYEAAASRPDRVQLENIRRGEFEALREAIGRDPDRAPDFGPSRLGPAGATVIGARRPLIAYNVYLDTSDLQLAKDVARRVRQSSGGLPAVKALGMLVEGRAQVSMNLTDYERTSLPAAYEAVVKAAAARGAAVHHSELVGLIPQAALLEAARDFLRLEPYSPDQVLETRLYAAISARPPAEGSFLEQLAAARPTPGGGSAAAYAAAMAAGLVGMVARLTLGKKKDASVQVAMQALAAKADEARSQLEAAVQADSEAFEAVLAARRQPKDTPAQQAARQAALEAATRRAGEVPLGVARASAELMEWAAEAAALGNANAVSDAASACALARAALTAAGWNVRINAEALGDEQIARGWTDALQALEPRAASAETKVRAALKERGGVT